MGTKIGGKSFDIIQSAALVVSRGHIGSTELRAVCGIIAVRFAVFATGHGKKYQMGKRFLHTMLDGLIFLLAVSAICGTVWFLITLMLGA